MRRITMDKEKMVKIAYVILTWNSQRHITACIESIFCLRGYLSQVIVVDNASCDGTLAALETLRRGPPSGAKLEVLRLNTNLGTTRPRNLGLARVDADTDYICILDSDTQINETAMDLLLQTLEENPDCGLVGPKLVTASGLVQASARNFPTLLEKLYKAAPLKRLQQAGEAIQAPAVPSGQARAYAVDYLMSACWVLRPSLLSRVGLLDEEIFYAPEDAEFCIRVAKAGVAVLYCPQAVVIHEWQRISKKKFFSRHNWEHIKGLGHMFAKHRYLFRTDKIRAAANAKAK